MDQIAASMVEFGWTNPILVDENAGILAGHGRLRQRVTLPSTLSSRRSVLRSKLTQLSAASPSA